LATWIVERRQQSQNALHGNQLGQDQPVISGLDFYFTDGSWRIAQAMEVLAKRQLAPIEPAV
jgi:hypothetical protein